MPRTTKQAYGITLTSFLQSSDHVQVVLFSFFHERSIKFGVYFPYFDLLTNQIFLSPRTFHVRLL
jgi:hypothetical protein